MSRGEIQLVMVVIVAADRVGSLVFGPLRGRAVRTGPAGDVTPTCQDR